MRYLLSNWEIQSRLRIEASLEIEYLPKSQWLMGKQVNNISVVISSIGNVEIYPSSTRGEYVLYTPNPHEFEHLDIITISGISTTTTKIEGSYKAIVKNNALFVVGLGTGIIISINWIGDIF